MKFVLYTVKGLEDIVENELLQKCPDAAVISKSNKCLTIEIENSEPLLGLRCVDDLSIHIHDINFKTLVIDLNALETSLDYLKKFRESHTGYTITKSIVGSTKKAFLFEEFLKTSLADLGYSFNEDSRTNLDFRIFVNSNESHLSLRLTKEPLGKRSYTKAKYLGSLKPTIAASMVFLASKSLNPSAVIVDNFCGSGTLLKEAQALSYLIEGGDINVEAVRIARKVLNTKLNLQDAVRTNFKNTSFDCAISNFPWDKQHPTSSITDLYVGALKEYHRILRPQCVLCFICHKPDLLIKHIKKEFGQCYINEFKLGYLGQTPTIVLAVVTG